MAKSHHSTGVDIRSCNRLRRNACWPPQATRCDTTHAARHNASMAGAPNDYYNRTTARAMRILELLASASPMTLADIARGIDASKSSVYPIVRTLAGSGFLEAVGEDGYRLTARTSALARPSTNRMRLIESFYEAVRNSKLGSFETVILTETTGSAAIVIAEHMPDDRSVRLSVPVGTHLPLHATASGKVVMSQWSSDAVHIALGSQQLPQLTARTTTDLASLLDELERIRESGIAESWGELDAGTTSAAVIIDLGQGQRRAALAVVVPIHRAEPTYWALTKLRLAELSRALNAAHGSTDLALK